MAALYHLTTEEVSEMEVRIYRKKHGVYGGLAKLIRLHGVGVIVITPEAPKKGRQVHIAGADPIDASELAEVFPLEADHYEEAELAEIICTTVGINEVIFVPPVRAYVDGKKL